MNTYMLLHIYEVTSLQPGILVTTRPKLVAITISGPARHLLQILHNRHFPPTFSGGEKGQVTPLGFCRVHGAERRFMCK